MLIRILCIIIVVTFILLFLLLVYYILRIFHTPMCNNNNPVHKMHTYLVVVIQDDEHNEITNEHLLFLKKPRAVMAVSKMVTTINVWSFGGNLDLQMNINVFRRLLTIINNYYHPAAPVNTAPSSRIMVLILI